MKFVLLSLFGLLAVMSLAAWYATPHDTRDGRKIIVWASDDNPRRRAQIDSFNRLHPQYLLEIDPVNKKEDIDKVVTQSLAGVGPDAFDGYRDKLALLHEAGLLHDITDALAARGITLDTFWPLARSQISIDGRIYGVPFNIGGDAIWYHRDVFDAEGIPHPPPHGWAWDDFVATAKRLTKRDARGRVTRYGVMNLAYVDVLMSSGGRVLSRDGRRCVIDSAVAVDALQKWVDLERKHGVTPSPTDEASMQTAGGWNSGVLTLFKEKRVAMAGGGRWWLCMLRDLRDDRGQFPLNLDVVEKPITRFRIFGGGSRVTLVNGLSPNRDRAVEFIVHLCSDQHADQLNRDADGMPGPIRASTRPAYYHDPNGGRDAGASEVWKSILAHAAPEDISPYVTGKFVNDTLTRQLELVRQGIKTPQQGLKRVADEINAEIARNVAREPSLARRFHGDDRGPVYDNRPDLVPLDGAVAGGPR